MDMTLIWILIAFHIVEIALIVFGIINVNKGMKLVAQYMADSKTCGDKVSNAKFVRDAGYLMLGAASFLIFLFNNIMWCHIAGILN